jgi:hypothetical protein
MSVGDRTTRSQGRRWNIAFGYHWGCISEKVSWISSYSGRLDSQNNDLTRPDIFQSVYSVFRYDTTNSGLHSIGFAPVVQAGAGQSNIQSGRNGTGGNANSWAGRKFSLNIVGMPFAVGLLAGWLMVS